jgi:hypothetical protein
MDPITEQTIRTVESQILDVHHKKQPLLRYPISVSIPNIIVTFGNILRDLAGKDLDKYHFDTLRHHASFFLKGTEWALRWALKEGMPSSGSDTWKQLDAETVEILSWGRKYAELVTAHTAWSRGELSASVNEQKHEIRFDLPGNYEPTVLISQWTSDGLAGDDFLATVPKALAEIYEQWSPNVTSRESGNACHACDFISHSQEVAIQNWADSCLFPELPPDVDLGGFTLQDFRQFYSGLFTACHCWALYEDAADKVSQTNAVPSAIMNTSMEEAIFYLSYISGLAEQKLKRIVEMLTFDPSRLDHSLATHPFVVDSSQVWMLCRLFAATDPYQILTCALIRQRRSIYEALVEELQAKNVLEIATALQTFGFEVFTFRRFSDEADGNVITPDLVLFDSKSECLAVGDYKHAIPPRSSREVANKLKERLKWAQQVRRYLAFAESRPETLQKQLGLKKPWSTIRGFLLHRSPLPIPAELTTDVTFLDWVLLRRILKGSPGAAIGEILNYFHKLRPLPGSAEVGYRIEHLSTQVGEWTYLRPILVGKSATQLSTTGDPTGVASEHGTAAMSEVRDPHSGPVTKGEE